MRERWQQRKEQGERGSMQRLKKKKVRGLEKNSERERQREGGRERGHVGFGLLVLPSGQLADLFI